MTTREEVVQKAVKLLRLANSSNAGEAANAAAAAQSLMDRYNLGVLSAEYDSGSSEPEEPIRAFKDDPLESNTTTGLPPLVAPAIIGTVNVCSNTVLIVVDGQAVDWDAAWEKALTDNPPHCPLCGAGMEENLRYDEYVLSFRRVRGVGPTGQLVVDGYSEEVWDSTKGEEIYCEACGASMPLPKGGIEWQ